MLANVVLDELDWELERRGHRFARYADDCNILVRSQRAGERVMASVKRFLSDTLRLTVNPLKSAVDRPAKRKFLGFTVSRRDARLKVADQAIDKLGQRGILWVKNRGLHAEPTIIPVLSGPLGRCKSGFIYSQGP